MWSDTLRRLVRFLALMVVGVAASGGGRGAGAQSAGAITGSVSDSLTGTALAGARVQLVSAAADGRFGQTTQADATGRFLFEGVPPGKYLVAFLHPMLDSLGVESPVREVTVTGTSAAQVDLAIPGARRLRAALCEGSTTGAVVVGYVRPTRAGVDPAGIAVGAQWTELSVGRNGISSRSPRRTTVTRANGWFALCNVPGPGTIFIVASRGADSTDIVETQVPAEGLLRRDLYLGASRAVVVRDSAGAGDSVVSRRMLTGDGRLSGRVMRADGGTPMRDAQVRIVNGPSTRTDERGYFTLTGLPEGTRTLDVRSVGYYPDRRTVNVVEGAPATTVTMVTLRSVLDTMKIRASRTRVQNLQGFMDRMHRGQGRYLTSADIERRMSQFTIDIFRNQPGVKIEGDSLLVRGIGGYGELYCSPTIYLDGRAMRGIGSSDINLLVTPKEIRGVEIYAATQVPPEFSDGLTGCGAILFWTR